jgi:hypothetical protein
VSGDVEGRNAFSPGVMPESADSGPGRRRPEPLRPCTRDLAETSHPPTELPRREPRHRPPSRPCHPTHHGDPAYRRHRASGKSMNALELSCRAIFALSTGLPTMAFAMLDQPAPPVTPRKERRCLLA